MISSRTAKGIHGLTHQLCLWRILRIRTLTHKVWTGPSIECIPKTVASVSKLYAANECLDLRHVVSIHSNAANALLELLEVGIGAFPEQIHEMRVAPIAVAFGECTAVENLKKKTARSQGEIPIIVVDPNMVIDIIPRDHVFRIGGALVVVKLPIEDSIWV